jgi:hypothetical protein
VNWRIGEFFLLTQHPHIQYPTSSIQHQNYPLSIFNYQLKILLLPNKSKLDHKMDDGPAKRNENNNLLSVGMSSLP